MFRLFSPHQKTAAMCPSYRKAQNPTGTSEKNAEPFVHDTAEGKIVSRGTHLPVVVTAACPEGRCECKTCHGWVKLARKRDDRRAAITSIYEVSVSILVYVLVLQECRVILVLGELSPPPALSIFSLSSEWYRLLLLVHIICTYTIIVYVE